MDETVITLSASDAASLLERASRETAKLDKAGAKGGGAWQFWTRIAEALSGAGVAR